MNKGGQRIVGVDEIMLKTRFNPLLRAINMIKKIKNLERRLEFTLEIAPYFYGRAQRDASAPLSPSQSANNAQQAHKLLTALENNIKTHKKALVEQRKENMTLSELEAYEKKDEIRPLPAPGTGIQEGPASSDQPGLGNGTPQV